MSPHRILLVEDQREVSTQLRSSLQTLDYDLELVEFQSGEEAILDGLSNQVDLLVSEYHLPGMTGTALMRKVKKHHPKCKVILLTGQEDSKIRKEVADCGADALFTKPVPMAEFIDAIERHLELVPTLLPPEPIIEQQEVKPQFNLPDLLSTLRQDLEASAVILMNDAGHILARAGDLPDPDTEVALLSSLLSIHSATQKVSHLLGHASPATWHTLMSGEHDLIFTPLGLSHALLGIGKGLVGEARLQASLDILTAACKNIETLIIETPQAAPLEPEALPAVVEEEEPGGLELDPLFKNVKKKLKNAEVDEFWNKAAGEHRGPAKPDMLTYDQAKQLGLAPEDES